MLTRSYLDTAKNILTAYDGAIPFASFLKKFFGQEKKYGSRDRRAISHLCYCYFRLGASLTNLSMDEKLLAGQFLCSNGPNRFLQELNPAWDEKITVPVREKFRMLQDAGKVFSFSDELSAEIDSEALNASLLVQPDLFLRIRPGHREQVLNKLKTAEIEFILEEPVSLRLANSTKIEDLLQADREVLIQDLNSQQVFSLIDAEDPQPRKCWDCCAASGGKSILFHDRFPNASLTVSDIRESILINLKNRFKRADIKNYHSFIADLSKPGSSVPTTTYDFIICDAPCSGSGTWSRTPEQLLFFKTEKIGYYAALQQSIALNAAKALKKDGYFIYITCSVFRRENEAVVDFLQENSSLALVEKSYLKGYDKKADTLFVAVFKL